MDYILASRHSFPSAKLLREVFSSHGPQLFVTSEPRRKPPLIRYGNFEGDFSKDTPLNNKEFIRLLCNKKSFADLLLENEIYAPSFTKNNPSDDDFPIVIRQTLTGCKGTGIIICKTREEYNRNKGYFWTRWVPVTNEFRVHVVGGKVTRIFRKILLDGVEKEEFPIRSSERYHFSLISDNDRFPKLAEVVSKISGIFGDTNFYGLDVGWDNNKKDWFIFEANSAPGLNEITANIYSDFIFQVLGGS